MREVVVVGVYKMSSSRVKSLRVDTTRLRKLSSRQSENSIKAVFVVVVVGVQNDVESCQVVTSGHDCS